MNSGMSMRLAATIIADDSCSRELGALLIDENVDVSIAGVDEVIDGLAGADPSVIIIDGDLLDDESANEIADWSASSGVMLVTICGDEPSSTHLLADVRIERPISKDDVRRIIQFAKVYQWETLDSLRSRRRKMVALQEVASSRERMEDTRDRLRWVLTSGKLVFGAEAIGVWLPDAVDRALHHSASIGLSSNVSFDQISWTTVESPLPAPDETGSVSFSQLSPHGAIRPALMTDQFSWRWATMRYRQHLAGHLAVITRRAPSGAAPVVDPFTLDSYASILGSVLTQAARDNEARQLERFYRELVSSSPTAVVMINGEGIIEAVNRAMMELMRLTEHVLLGEPLGDWIGGPDPLPLDEWNQMPAGPAAEPIERWLVRPDAERRRVEIRARRVDVLELDVRPRLDEMRVQLTIDDVTDSRRRMVELELLQELTTMVSEGRPLPEVHELISSRLYGFLGYRLVSIGTVDMNDLEFLAYRNYLDQLATPISFSVRHGLCGLAIRENRSVLAEDVFEWNEYMEYDSAVESEVVVPVRIHGKPVGLIDIQSDSSLPLGPQDLTLMESIATHLGILLERNELQARLQEQAMTDALTGTWNRGALTNHIDELIQGNSDSNQHQSTFTMLFVELDRFKGLNDRFGHLFGDQMLIQVCQRIQSILDNAGFVARYGGDEIAVILPALEKGEALDLAERIRRGIGGQPFIHGEQSATMTVSIGVALYPDHGSTTDELLASADRAMYEAKNRGRNLVCVAPDL
jgi:diguanylate cyclase (GGDEF)-like protein